LLLRGSETSPRQRADFDQHLIDGLLRLARLADSVASYVRDHPDQQVRRSAAILAAQAHPLRAAWND
jgi:hypothetical protein